MVVDFAAMENLDAYRDGELGDIILGKEFCRKTNVLAKRFDGFITISSNVDSVTYQMARSHPRLLHGPTNNVI